MSVEVQDLLICLMQMRSNTQVTDAKKWIVLAARVAFKQRIPYLDNDSTEWD